MNITNYTPFKQNQNTITEALFTNRAITPQKSATLSPIQIAFRQLANNPLLSNTISKITIKKGNASIPWTMAQVEALFNAIYTSGITNDKDLQQIQSLSQEIENIEKNLKNIQASPQEKKVHKKCLKLAKQALLELTSFPKALNQYQATKQAFENALDLMVDRTYSPLYAGEALSSFSEIPQCIEALQTLENQIESLPENSSIRLRLQENLDGHIYEFSFFLYDWQDEIDEFTEKESKELIFKFKNAPQEKKEDLRRQLSALTHQQSILAKQVEDLSKKLSKFSKVDDALAASLQETAENMRASILSTSKRLKNEKINLTAISKPITFGDKDWCAFSIDREEENHILKNSNRNFFADFLHSLTDFENWSDYKKSIISNLFTLAQIGHQGLEFSQKINQVQYLRTQAEAAAKKVTPEMEQKINRDNAYLGTLLSDKYQKIIRNPDLIEHFSQGNELIRDGIQQAVNHFGLDTPNRIQLFEFLDAYKSTQYAKTSQSPFAHLSISEWIEIFTKPEKEPEKENIQPSIFQNTDKMAVIPHRILSLGNDQQQFKSIIESEMRDLINARELLNKEIKLPVNSALTPLLASLQKQISLLEGNQPTETSTLSELAQWMQSIKDLIYAIPSTIINTINPPFIQNAFHIAVRNNQPQLIPYLSNKAGINAEDSNGNTPLDLAIENKNLDMVKALIDSFANVNYINKNKLTPLHLAFRYGDITIMEQLLKADRSMINVPDSSGKSVLEYAVDINDEKMIRLLLSYGADIKVIEEDGWTPALRHRLLNNEDYHNLFDIDDYTEIASSIKVLSHAFELSGYLPLGGKQFELERGYTRYFSSIFINYITKFAEQFPGLEKSEVEWLQKTLNTQKISSEQSYQKFLDEGSLLVHGGFSGHAVDIYLHNDISTDDGYIIVGNKGALSNKPLEIYKFNKNEITLEFIEKIKRVKKGDELGYLFWIDNLPYKVNGQRVELTSLIEDTYPLLFEQIVGNCAWESTEAVLFGMIALKRLLKAPKAPKSDILKDLQKTYVRMTQFFQLEAFEEYLKKYLCEYHHVTPKLESDRTKYLSLKSTLHKTISKFPKVFSEKIKSIESLLSLVDKEFIPLPKTNEIETNELIVNRSDRIISNNDFEIILLAMNDYLKISAALTIVANLKNLLDRLVKPVIARKSRF